VAPSEFPPGSPNFLYIGDHNGSNPPFVIHLIPEPGSVLLFGLGTAQVLYRRRRE
jgi:hypothetical protein